MAGIDDWTAESFAVDEFEDLAYDPGPPISIRSLKAAARRRRRLWISTAFAGLILGASLHVLLPSKITAVSRLYLEQPAGADPNVAIENDLSLLGTRTVGETAMGVLHLGSNQPLISYRGLSAGTSILSIKATGPTAAQAVARTNAVAQAFLQVRATLEQQTTNEQVATLQDEIRSLEADMQTPKPASSPQAEQMATDAAQITQLNEKIIQDKEGQTSIRNDSVVLDRAYVVPVSLKKTAIKDGLSGLIAGLGLGLAIVIIGEMMSDRVRARSDVAAALGAPVELSLDRLP